MDINIIRYIFIFNSIIIGITGLLITCLESRLPLWLTRTIRYGKYSAKEHHFLVAKFEVPKKWFKHFYIFAGPASIATLLLILYKYLFNGTLPDILFMTLDTLFSTLRKPLVSAEDAILAVVLLSIHCCKRMYESFYVNIFSNQKMHLFHYLVGFIHYTGVFICMIGEAEGFVIDTHAHFSWHKLIRWKLIYAFVFLWSSYMQFGTNVVLRNLRKSEHNDISYGYKMPFDGLYKYISAPLQFTEIIIYLMLSMILWQASTFHYITLWVIMNQVECAILSHWWYHTTFKRYPKERKILIPFVW